MYHLIIIMRIMGSCETRSRELNVVWEFRKVFPKEVIFKLRLETQNKDNIALITVIPKI